MNIIIDNTCFDISVIILEYIENKEIFTKNLNLIDLEMLVKQSNHDTLYPLFMYHYKRYIKNNKPDREEEYFQKCKILLSGNITIDFKTTYDLALSTKKHKKKLLPYMIKKSKIIKPS